MTYLLYVRTTSGGTGPDVLLPDLGITVFTSATWTLLSSSSPNRAEGSAGQFTAREIRDSVDLWGSINSGSLEWSKDGITVQSSASYTADYMLFEDFTDDDPNFENLTVSGTLIASGFNITSHFDGGPNKHDASEIDVEGTYPNIPGAPGDLESVLASINSSLSGVAAYSFANIVTDAGTAVADAAADTLTVVGADGILTGAVPGTDTITISGTALLPRDGSRPMTGDLNLAFNDIINVQDLQVSGVATFTHADLLLPVDTVAPASPLVAGQTVVVAGIQYIYDTSRSKWLSVHRPQWLTDRNANASNIYMRVGEGTSTQQTGVRISRNATITAISVQTDGTETWTFEIRKNDVVTPIVSLAVVAAQGAHSNVVNVDISAGDELQFYVNGSGIDHPVATVEIAWRL